MKKINERIRSLRKDLGLSQGTFSEAIGVSQAHISKVERGRVAPSNHLIKSICREFGVSEKWLRTGEGDREGEKWASPLHETINMMEIMDKKVATLLDLYSSTLKEVNEAIKRLLRGNQILGRRTEIATKNLVKILREMEDSTLKEVSERVYKWKMQNIFKK